LTRRTDAVNPLTAITFMTFTKKWKTLLKFTGPALFVFFLFKIVDFQAVISLLAHIRPGFVILSAILFPLLTACLTFRWWLVCRQLDMPVSFGALTRIYYVTWFLGILPFTGTTVVAKILYLNSAGEKTSTTAVSLAFDKLLDIAGLLLFGLLGALYLPKGLIDTGSLWVAWGVAFGMAILVAAFGSRAWKALKIIANRYLSRRLKAIGSSLESDLSGLWAGFHFPLFCKHLLLAVVINLLRGMILYVLALALDIQITYLQALACRALIGIVNFIPISNSGLGTRDAVLLLVLPLWGVSVDAALALGLTAFVWTIFTKAAGIVFWFQQPLPIQAFLDARHNLFKKRPEQPGQPNGN
jgi:uncharacterized protein (TIRG00374 family)